MPGCGMHRGPKLALSSKKSRQAHSKQIENKHSIRQNGLLCQTSYWAKFKDRISAVPKTVESALFKSV